MAWGVILKRILPALPYVGAVAVLIGVGFILGWKLQSARIAEKDAEISAYEVAIADAEELAKAEAKRRKDLAEGIQKRLDRINNGPVSTKVLIEDRYVYIPDNSSCVVRVNSSRDEPATITGSGSDTTAAVLDVSKIQKAYTACRNTIQSLDGFEGRVKVLTVPKE